MPAAVRPFLTGWVLAMAVAGAGHAQTPAVLLTSAPTLRGTTAPPQKAAYRGSYPRVGKPVRAGKSTALQPVKGVSDLPCRASAILAFHSLERARPP